MNRYLKDSSLTLGARLFVLCLSVTANIIIARVLGPSGKGVLTIVYLFPFFLALAARLGIDEANVYLLGSNKAPYNKIFGNSICLSVFMGAILVVVLLAFRTQVLSGFLRNLNQRLFVLSVLCIPLFLFWHCALSILRGLGDFLKFNVLDIVRASLYLALCILFLLILKSGVFGAALALPISMGAVVVISLVVLWKVKSPQCRPDPAVFRQSIPYGMKALPGIVLSFFNKRLDMFVINFFLSPAQVGYYAISVSLAELLWHLPNSFATTLFTKVAGINDHEANQITSKVVRNISLAMIVSGSILAIFAKPMIQVAFGRRFLPSLIPFWLLLPGVLALGITKLICSDFHGRGKPQYGTFLTIISVIFTIVLDIVLIPRFGIAGAAIASSVAYCVAMGIAVIWFSRESHLPATAFLIAKRGEIATNLLLAKQLLVRGASRGHSEQ